MFIKRKVHGLTSTLIPEWEVQSDQLSYMIRFVIDGKTYTYRYKGLGKSNRRINPESFDKDLALMELSPIRFGDYLKTRFVRVDSKVESIKKILDGDEVRKTISESDSDRNETGWRNTQYKSEDGNEKFHEILRDKFNNMTEDEVAQDAWLSVAYASITKERFILGEKAISKNDQAWSRYLELLKELNIPAPRTRPGFLPDTNKGWYA